MGRFRDVLLTAMPDLCEPLWRLPKPLTDLPGRPNGAGKLPTATLISLKVTARTLVAGGRGCAWCSWGCCRLCPRHQDDFAEGRIQYAVPVWGQDILNR